MHRFRTLICTTFLLACASTQAGELGFLEEFALSEDRGKLIEKLIPGTADFYYYSALHAQNEGRPDDVDRLLTQWIKRHGRTSRVDQIELRQALISYPTRAAASLKLIQQRLGLSFGHQRDLVPGERPLPTSLDPNLISFDRLTQNALRSHPKTLDGFESRSLARAAQLELDADQRRQLLSRLEVPDLPQLTQLVAADLAHKHSRGFGSLKIHREMLLSQLNELLAISPKLRDENKFVSIYLTKLQPSSDVNWQQDTPAREAYFDRLWSFVSKLSPAHNSLKAHVLYHRLAHDRALGRIDRDRFMTYLKLPRRVSYMRPEYLLESELARHSVNLREGYRGITPFDAIGLDEPLVRSFLAHFFRDAEDYKDFERYVSKDYLKATFAETKILAGVGDMETWYSWLSPARLEALKERVDIAFDASSKTIYDSGEQVGISVWVKNVPSLIVKVFEINNFEYFRTYQREVDTSIDLDGFVASYETVHEYTDAPLRRIKRRFEFPDLPDRGTFVVEFIGNGKSSRALIRKGRLRFLERVSSSGHLFVVLDDAGEVLKDAGIWLGGNLYTPDQTGTIVVPFSNQPGRRKIILAHDGFATLENFDHSGERYSLDVRFHVERESLIRGETARLIVRPAVLVNGVSTSVSVLEDVELTLTSTDHDGVESARTLSDYKLYDNQDSTHDFLVPNRLSNLRFHLKAKVENLSSGKTENVAASSSISVNQIDKTHVVSDLHLSRSARGYSVSLLGRTGENRADRPVTLTLKHRDFRDPVRLTMRSDASGRIELGQLAGIAWVQGKPQSGATQVWSLAEDWAHIPGLIHAKTGDTVRLPHIGSSKKATREEFALLERNRASLTKDRFSALRIRQGFLEVRDLAAGDYDLWIKNRGTRVRLRIADGESKGGYVLSGFRQLEQKWSAPLHIASTGFKDDQLEIRLANAGENVRLHVVGNRFVPSDSIGSALGTPRSLLPRADEIPRPESAYVVGREIGDEYRYILERRYSKRYPGNMLARPSLILNPWAVRNTQTTRVNPATGEAFGSSRAPMSRNSLKKREGRSTGGDAEGEGYSSYDFLAKPASVLTNLRPDDKGVVRVPLAQLGDAYDLHIVASDGRRDAIQRRISLSEKPQEIADLRLAESFDSTKHYTEKQQVSVVAQESRFEIEDLTTSSFELFDSLNSVYRLLRTLSGNSTLDTFAFVLEWPTLDQEEKRKLFSEHACHELAFFVYKKDPEFFRAVVQPFLSSKLHKTFLDHWLLEDDLTDYLRPWSYQRLNVVERLLLAERVDGEKVRAAQHLKDLFELLRPQPADWGRRFETALSGKALQAGAKYSELKSVRGRGSRSSRAVGGRMRVQSPAAKPGGFANKGKRAPGREDSLAEDLEEMEMSPAEFADESLDVDGKPGNQDRYLEDSRARRKKSLASQLFRQLDQTQEWAENNYYKIPIEAQIAGLVDVNAFWHDYATRKDGPFFSAHFAEASQNFTEIMFALSVLDLPFQAGDHATGIAKAKLTLNAATPLIVFHREIQETVVADQAPSLLISQNYYRLGERFRTDKGMRVDNFVSEEFIRGLVYGGHVVVTNPTSTAREVDILIQVPQGAIPVANARYTKSFRIVLEPYRTWTQDTFFYFPESGTFPQFPVHVASDEKTIAFADATNLKVVDEPSKVDRSSWEWISQNGTSENVLQFLRENNPRRVPLARIAWRMKDKAFFESTLRTLDHRHVYDSVLWSYGIHHDVPWATTEYLRHDNRFVSRLGGALSCELINIDPVERKTYQHLEYAPIVNARAHQLGQKRQIVNDRLYSQYQSFLRESSFLNKLDDETKLQASYYLFVQDRVEEALSFLGSVRASEIESKLQYDYLTSFAGFYTEDLRQSRAVASQHLDHPVDRWRKKFETVIEQLDEIENGVDASHGVDKTKDLTQNDLASKAPSFEFRIDSDEIVLTHENIDRVTVNYYLMDLELLFSRSPFVSGDSGQFAFVKPNFSVEAKLEAGQSQSKIELPKELRTSNVLVEIRAAGQRRTQSYFANQLNLQVVENFARLRVGKQDSAKPLSKVYVKVFAQYRDGRVAFYKDGYTDLRGRFNYGSLSTNDLQNVEKFSILVLSDEHGAVVREARPPQL